MNEGRPGCAGKETNEIYAIILIDLPLSTFNFFFSCFCLYQSSSHLISSHLYMAAIVRSACVGGAVHSHMRSVRYDGRRDAMAVAYKNKNPFTIVPGIFHTIHFHLNIKSSADKIEKCNRTFDQLSLSMCGTDIHAHISMYTRRCPHARHHNSIQFSQNGRPWQGARHERNKDGQSVERGRVRCPLCV